MLVHAMGLARLDRLRHGKVEAGPPALPFDIGHQQMPATLVDAALGRLYDQAEGPFRLVPGPLDVQRQEADPFAGAGFDEGIGVFGARDPKRLVLRAGIPFGDEVEGPVQDV